jgi:hypothetical protein
MNEVRDIKMLREKFETGVRVTGRSGELKGMGGVILMKDSHGALVLWDHLNQALHHSTKEEFWIDNVHPYIKRRLREIRKESEGGACKED